MTILMVCLGNICRSPLAEGILREKCKKAGLDWKIESAGTNGFHNGEAPHYLSQKVASINNIDISSQQSRKFVKQDFERFDKIYAMAEDVIVEIKQIGKEQYISSKVNLLMDEVYPKQNKEVPDPFYGAEDGYHSVYKMIEIACDAIIKNHANLST
ncbi:MAG: low molecular weight phosphotyrosine protein phosphatase [Chitinophagia bacterium]|jgi:protein-tyrosine phosphatase|nr:low molecular weight phosphotyrosine protein phosphatase [Chitinophagia bacterium]